MNAQFRLRDARDEDCHALTALCLRSKARRGYHETFLAQCRDALTVTPAKLASWYVRVAESRDGSLIGVLAISFEHTGRGVEAEVELLFVDPAVIRTGVGRALMNDGRRHAQARGADALWMLSDPGAEPFYRRLGAIRVGLRPSDAIAGRRLPWMRLFVGAEIPRLRTERLLLRPWRDDDLAGFFAINADPRVAQYLPKPLTQGESDALAARIRGNFERYGFGLWAAERADDPASPFIGFIGLAEPTFEAPFTPCVEIGWRLASAHWGVGLATEGSRAVVQHAFDEIGLDAIVSFTVPENLASRRVMEKLGMQRDPGEDFDHPSLPVGHPLRRHVLYRLGSDSAPSRR